MKRIEKCVTKSGKSKEKNNKTFQKDFFFTKFERIKTKKKVGSVLPMIIAIN